MKDGQIIKGKACVANHAKLPKLYAVTAYKVRIWIKSASVNEPRGGWDQCKVGVHP